MQVVLYRLLQSLMFFFLLNPGYKIYTIEIDGKRTLLQTLEIAGAVLTQISVLILLVKRTYFKKYIQWVLTFKPPLNPLFGLLVILIPVSLYLNYFYIYQGEYYGFNPQGFTFSVLFFFIGAFTEEFVFRGYFFKMVVSKHKKYALHLIVAQALIFTFIHFNNPGNSYIRIGVIFLAGCLLGLIALKGFAYAVVFHFLWNFLQAYMLGLNVSGFVFLNSFNVLQKAPAWENNIFSVIPLLVTIVILLVFYRRNKKSFV